MKKHLIFLIFLFPSILYGNGGPVDMSHFRKTGNIRLMTKKNVLLKKEDLNITVIGDYTEIDVQYELQNLGKQQNIQYGFPVDAYDMDWAYGEVYPVFSQHNDCVQYFEAYDNGEPIHVSQWIEDDVYKAPTVDLDEGNFHKKNEAFQIIRKWSAITLAFDENETKYLRIKYKIKNTLRDKQPGFRFIHRYSNRKFTYDLNPSSNWGNGVVEEFNLRIDLTDLGASKSVYDLNTTNISEVESHIFKKSIINYDLNKADRINISYNNRHLKMTEYINKHEVSEQVIQSIDCASNKATCHNLIDNQNTTKWTGKKGDWIEIEFKEKELHKKTIRGILLLIGDHSSPEKFKQSGKIKVAKVIINEEIEFNTEPWEGQDGSRLIKLKQYKYKKVNEENIIGLSTVLADGDDFNENLQKIRIEIIEIEGDSVDLFELYFVGF